MRSLLLAFFLALAPSVVPAQCVWGSFDFTRLNYAGGMLTSPGHSQLRAILAGYGGTVAPATPMITQAYLATVQVFYTSLLDTNLGSLSPAEQADLRAWVQAGGTLIVTSDYLRPTVYDSFTNWAGIGGWTSMNRTASGVPVGAHSITQGVTSYYMPGYATFTFGAGAVLLGNDDQQNAVIAVMESPTGANQRGRVLVFGDHNLFTDLYIVRDNNRTLANNMLRWACGPNCGQPAAWSNYGAGWAGTNGIPTLVASALPVLGTTFDVRGSNSLGGATAGVLVLGAAPVALPTPFDGSVLARPDLLVGASISATGFTLPLSVPSRRDLCGAALYLQLLTLDPGASRSWSFTPGLQLVLGN